MRLLFIIYPALIALMLAAGCSQSPEMAGATSETTNGISGAVLDKEGEPVAGARVLMRPSDYLSSLPTSAMPKRTVSRVDTVTDDKGSFLIDSVDPGEYFIEVTPEDSLATLYRVEVDPSDDLVAMEVRTLEKTAVVSGRITPSPGVSDAYVRVYGLERLVKADGVTGDFSLTLPPGYFTLRLSCIHEDGESVTHVDMDIDVSSGEVLDLGSIIVKDPSDPFYGWEHYTRVTINTSPSGADISEDVHNFPVLVRIDQTIIPSPFVPQSGISGDGRDIRFAKSDGTTSLPYEIERWDSLNEIAEIWVNVDTIYGNNDSQFIYMYMGNGAAPDQSSGPSVFDTTDGFAGVWHLNDDLSDATFHEFNGTSEAAEGDEAAAGVSGGAVDLDSNDRVNLGDIDMINQVSLSAWIKPSEYTIFDKVITKRWTTNDHPWHVYTLSLDSLHNVFMCVAAGPEVGTATGVTVPALDQWTHVAGTFDGALLRVFVNGVLEGEIPLAGTIVENDEPVYLGFQRDNDRDKFIGAMDEARISDRARSEDWFKLCYENQKPASTMLQFQP
jgi:hypothetical protein